MGNSVFAAEPPYFPVLGATEARKLIFDFSADLTAIGGGILLSGTPTVTYATLPNVPSPDPTPSDIANGSVAFDATTTQVIVPVNGANGVAGNDYQITVTSNTTDSKTVMTLSGILSIR